MSRRQHQVAKGGMFGTTSPQGGISKDTQELLKVMMKESRLTNFQQRKLKESVSSSKPLPTKVPPTNSYKPKVTQTDLPARKTFTMRGQPVKNVKTKEMIEGSGAYKRDKFIGRPTVSMEKEKSKLSNIMAFGKDIEPLTKNEILKKHREEMERSFVETQQVDRFDEIQREIEERRQFLQLMIRAGKSGEVTSLINSQISKLVREMEVIDRRKNEELERLEESLK